MTFVFTKPSAESIEIDDTSVLYSVYVNGKSVDGDLKTPLKHALVRLRFIASDWAFFGYIKDTNGNIISGFDEIELKPFYTEPN